MKVILLKNSLLISLLIVTLCLLTGCRSKMKTDNDNFSALKHQDIDWLRGKKINSADSISTTMGYGIYYIFNY